MPEYLAPGVFVEETSFRAKSIEGVSTSVAAIVGPTRYGPLRGKPEVCTSYGEFRRIFGDDHALLFAPASGQPVTVQNHTAHAARAFFDNGGKQLYVVRVARAGNEFPSDNDALPKSATFRTPLDLATFRSRHPGEFGNFFLELRWRGLESLLDAEAVTAPGNGDLVLVEIAALAAARVSAAAPGLPAAFPTTVNVTGPARVVVDAGGNRTLEMIGPQTIVQNAVAGDPAFAAEVAGMPAAFTIALTSTVTNVSLTRVVVRRPADATVGAPFPVVLDLRGQAPLVANDFLGRQIGVGRTPPVLLGECDGDDVTFRAAVNNRFDPDPLPAGQAATLTVDVTLSVAAFARPTAFLCALPAAFDVDVHTGSADGEVVTAFANVALDSGDPVRRDLAKAMAVEPTRSSDRLLVPTTATLDLDAVAAADRRGALFHSLWLACDPELVQGSEPRFVFRLEGGDDGAAPVSVDYAGEIDENLGGTGLCALEDVEDVSIVMTPAAAADPGSHQAVVNEMLTHCRRMRYRVGIVDSQQGMSFNEVRSFRNQFSDDRLALYYPWVVVSDPNVANAELQLPPAGFVAGTYARTDVNRGVHKAPANEVVFNALRFEIAINKFQQELLNPEGVNCLRSFPRLGHRIWGGRTLGADPEWKYVNVRRYFLYLERSIDKSTQWVVFEPNGERLWANVRDTVEAFLFNEWKEGHLLGSAPKEAYFVRCDRSTMTQNDLDNGRLVCLVGVAPLRPAEFVIFRVGQKTADA